MEFHKKASKIQEKYEKKLKIIEKDVKLSEEEKQKVYTNLQKKIIKHKNRNKKLIALANKTYLISSSLAGEKELDKFIVGCVSSLVLILGAVSLGAGLCSQIPVLTTIGAASTAFGFAATTNTLANSELFGDSVINTQISKILDKRCDIDNVLDDINHNIKTLIKPQNLEIVK